MLSIVRRRVRGDRSELRGLRSESCRYRSGVGGKTRRSVWEFGCKRNADAE